MRELLVLAVLAGLALLGTVGVLATEQALLRIVTPHPFHLPGRQLMKSAIANAAADTQIVPAEIVPTAAVTEYPAWLDGFEHRIVALVALARGGNRVAFNVVCDLHAKFEATSDQANQVAALSEHIGTGVG